MQRKPVLFACLLALSGCSRNGDTLDRFSRAYTAFLNQEFATKGSSLLPVVFNLENEGPMSGFVGADAYWTELRSALDIHASNSARLEHARNAINEDRTTIVKMMDAFSSEIGRLDGTVSQLIEIANSIRDPEYRSDAVGVSQRAREVQAGFASLRALYAEAFDRRRRVLERIVEDRGATLISPLLKQDSERISAVANRAEECRTATDLAMAGLKDAFSALTGKAGLKKGNNIVDKSN
jgi:hypothetical protein